MTLRRMATFGVAFLLSGCGSVVAPPVIIPVSASAPSGSACPAVVAHKTSPFDAPENSVPGIAISAELGVKVVEVDVRWSSSGYPVLMHDETIDRTTTGTGKVAELGLKYMVSLPANDYAPWKTDSRFTDVKVPYAWDFLNAARNSDVDLLLDTKVTPSRAAMDKLIEYVDRFSYRSRIVVMASAAAVTTMHAMYPDLRYVVIEYPPADMLRTADSVKKTGADGYALSWDRTTQQAASYYKSSGLDFYVWTSDRPTYDVADSWQKLASWGVDRIITNHPDDAITQVC